MGELKDKAKGIGNEVAGNAKQMTADATDDPSLDAEGKAQERKGEAQNVSGEIKGAMGDKV
ncbi:CsbD family protein [Tsuneonella sp. SYSU-LHT278]|uniref:CsbD family protein n=1 Tax=Tsuneonella sediminis TaxID=3416089 RepID=UPI003F7B09D2